MASLGKRLIHAFNAFAGNDRDTQLAKSNAFEPYHGVSYGGNSAMFRFRPGGEKTIISSIYTRLSIDFSDVAIRHVRLDDQGRYLEDMDSQLNNCLTVEANIDQAARAFRQDIALTLFDRGTIAICPVITTEDPRDTAGWDVKTMRVGEIIEWFPEHVKINLWRQETGRREQIIVRKDFAAVVDNPLYSVMNQPNSILQRLIRKLNLLDAVDEESASGKMNVIIQLPYQVKTETKRTQARQRLTDLQDQMQNNAYGVAYIDGTERVIQLNRPSENNLMTQVQYLTDQLYTTLGITPEVMNGTADEAAMINYYRRSIKPVLDAVAEAMQRTFLTKTARSQGQAIRYFREAFALVPFADLAQGFDILARNEIASSNELRSILGWRPDDNPKSDQLVNSNMPVSDTGLNVDGTPTQDSGSPDVNGAFDQIDKALDDTFAGLGVDQNAS